MQQIASLAFERILVSSQVGRGTQATQSPGSASLQSTTKRSEFCLALALAFLACVGQPLHAQQDAVWIGGTGNWNDMGSWLSGTVPANGSFNVLIDDSDAGTNSDVTLNIDATISSLSIDNGDTLRAHRTLTSATAVNGGTIYLNFAGELAGSGTWTNTGTIQGGNAGGTISVNLDNQGLVDANDSNNFGRLTINSATVMNSGMGILQASNGTVLNLSTGTITSVGDAKIRADGGTVRLIDDVTLVDSHFETAGSSTIVINTGQTAHLAGVETTNDGLFEVRGGTLVIDNVLTLNGTGTTTIQFGGSISGTPGDTLTNAAGHTINGGPELGSISADVNNLGVVESIAGPNSRMTISSANFTNGATGILRASGGLLDLSTGTITSLAGSKIIANGGTVQLVDDVTLVDSHFETGGGSNIVVNGGQTGHLAGTQTTNDGQFNVRGTLMIDNSLTLAGTGTTTVTNNGTIASAPGAVLTNAAEHTINTGPEGATISADLNNQGLVDAILGPNSQLTISSANLSNTGTLRASSIMSITNSFVNQGLVDAVGTLNVGDSWENAGNVVVNGQVSTTGTYTQTTGVTQLNGGTLSSTVLTDLQGGRLEGNGIVSGNVVSDAVIAAGLSAGQLNFSGNLTLMDNSVLEFELGGLSQGVNYDHLAINGTVVLDGDLDLAFINGFESTVLSTDLFTLLTSTLLSSQFDNVLNGQRLLTSDGLGSFQVNYGVGSAFNPNHVILSDFQTVGVPEPTLLIHMAMGGFLACAVFRRRKRMPATSSQGQSIVAV